MINFSLEIKENARLKDLYPAKHFVAKMKSAYRNGWDRIARTLNDDLDYMCSLPKTGEIYRIKGKLHQASFGQSRYSKNGESPAILSGFYLSQKKYNVTGWNKMIWGNDAPYANFLEIGTSRMYGRDGLRRTIERSQKLFVPIFGAELNREFHN